MMLFSFFTFLAVLIGALGDRDRHGCTERQFSCRDGQTCIFIEEWCDGRNHCPNYIDENFCTLKRNRTHPTVCPHEMMHCIKEGCFPQKGRCDGYRSCKDGSDEEGCPQVGHYQPDQTRIPENRPYRVPEASYTLDDVEDYDHNYEEDRTDYSEEDEKAQSWVKTQRRDYAWGEDTERAIVVQSLSEGKNLEDSKEGLLTIKSLHLRISLALAGRTFHRSSMSRRALSICALTASCGDPKNFYGFNLVADLRGSLNDLNRQKHAAPIVYLVLCMNNMSVVDDINRIGFQATALKRDSKNDLNALFLLTIVCMEKKDTFKGYKDYLVKLKRNLVDVLVKSNANNIYELALVTQALNAAEVNPESWDREEKMKAILNHQDKDGSFGDMLATYYVMPLLYRKSLLSIGEDCKHSTDNVETSMETLGNSIARINVNYTLNFGPEKISQTMFLSVLNTSTIYDAMNLAAKRNDNFRFSLDDKKSAPLVYSIGGTPNDAERGLFWNVQVFRRDRRYESPVSDIKTYVLQQGDAILFSLQFYSY